jgi:crotonobetainyl-CoA:carnitine CoA-transferase CaiB-like acyl-CoA transferase
MTDILEGIKVVELATVLAGPLVGSFLGEHGAEVVKIEPPGGDVTRSWRHPEESDSSYFAACNWSKSYQELDLKETSNREQLELLVREADVVISNFLPRVETKLRLSTADLQAINPKIIHAKLLGYRSEMTKPAYDAVLQAETGWMGLNGDQTSGPMKLPVAIVDLFAAHHMKQAILLAIIKRGQSGRGAVVTCDLESSAFSNLANQASLSLAGIATEAAGSLHPNIAPYGETLQFEEGERAILAVGSDVQFAALCQVLDCTQLVDDERFSSNKNRVINRKALMAEMQPQASVMSIDSFLEKCQEARVPVGKVNSLDEALSQPQAKALIVEDEMGRRITTSPFTIE